MKLSVCTGVCVLAAVLGGPRAFAQSVEGGIKAGVTSSTLSTSGLQGFNSQSGAAALGGGWIQVGRENVGLRVEVLRAVRKSSLVSGVATIDASSTSIDVPVLVVGRWRVGELVRPVLFGGVELGFITSASQTVGGVTTDIDEQIRDRDAGLVMGGAVEIGRGRRALVLDLRFSAGLQDISESSETTFKRRTLETSVGFRF